ncbi:Uncharacterised protein [Vibrio cholerae]|nr:Uncharacterised protein [Vibrio cholerae]
MLGSCLYCCSTLSTRSLAGRIFSRRKVFAAREPFCS